MAMVWIALLGGGDYAPEGLTGFGKFINLKWICGTQSVVWEEGYDRALGWGLLHVLHTSGLGSPGKFELHDIGVLGVFE